MIKGRPVKNLRDPEAEERLRQGVEATDAAAKAWAETVEDWDMDSLREQMIARAKLEPEVAAVWRRKPVRANPQMLRMVFEYARETGAVR